MTIRRKEQKGFAWRPSVVALVALAALAFLEITESRAADNWLTLTLASYHFERQKVQWDAEHSSTDHNERNWGIGLEHGLTPQWRLAAGVYRNSDYRTTVYVGGQWLPLRYRALRAGIMPVAASGYMHGLLITAVPTIAIEHRGFGANFFIVPQISNLPGVIGLQAKFRF